MTRFFLCLIALAGIASVVSACPPAVSVARQRVVSRSVTTVTQAAPVVSTTFVPTQVTTQKTVMVPTVMNVTKTVNVPVTTVSKSPPVTTTRTVDRLAFPVANRLLLGYRR